MKHPFLRRVEDDDIGGRAGGEAACFQAEGQRRTLAEQGQYFHQGHFVTDVEDLHGKAQRGFEAGDAVGSAVELLLFFVRGVGRVIGSDGVDGAVEEAFDHGGAIALGAQRGDSSLHWCRSGQRVSSVSAK